MNFRILICLALTMIVCLINAEGTIEHLILYYDYEKDPGNKVEDLSKVKNSTRMFDKCITLINLFFRIP